VVFRKSADFPTIHPRNQLWHVKRSAYDAESSQQAVAMTTMRTMVSEVALAMKEHLSSATGPLVPDPPHAVP
jgi:hypothetical protein